MASNGLCAGIGSDARPRWIVGPGASASAAF